MRVWLYARLSNDDDREMNSLLNQREICQAFAEQHGYIIVGQSFDDNISGMSFDRRGLDELTAAVDADMIDAVIVKDLSRLGRHRTQTALFIHRQDFAPDLQLEAVLFLDSPFVSFSCRAIRGFSLLRFCILPYHATISTFISCKIASY